MTKNTEPVAASKKPVLPCPFRRVGCLPEKRRASRRKLERFDSLVVASLSVGLLITILAMPDSKTATAQSWNPKPTPDDPVLSDCTADVKSEYDDGVSLLRTHRDDLHEELDDYREIAYSEIDSGLKVDLGFTARTRSPLRYFSFSGTVKTDSKREVVYHYLSVKRNINLLRDAGFSWLRQRASEAETRCVHETASLRYDNPTDTDRELLEKTPWSSGENDWSILVRLYMETSQRSGIVYVEYVGINAEQDSG